MLEGVVIRNTSIFSFSHNVFPPLVNNFHALSKSSFQLSFANAFNLDTVKIVSSRKRLTLNQKASQSRVRDDSRERVSTLVFFLIGPHNRRKYWCSSQEAESREISISCKNLFLNRCKINLFKLKLFTRRPILTLSQTKNFRLFPTEKNCIRQFQT